MDERKKARVKRDRLSVSERSFLSIFPSMNSLYERPIPSVQSTTSVFRQRTGIHKSRLKGSSLKPVRFELADGGRANKASFP